MYENNKTTCTHFNILYLFADIVLAAPPAAATAEAPPLVESLLPPTFRRTSFELEVDTQLLLSLFILIPKFVLGILDEVTHANIIMIFMT